MHGAKKSFTALMAVSPNLIYCWQLGRKLKKKMITTGTELIEHFKNYCAKQNKLFIPDSPRQEAVADSLVSFYKNDNLRLGLESFVRSRPGPFLVFDFAIESRSFVDKAQLDKKSTDKFKSIVEETKKRMETE